MRVAAIVGESGSGKTTLLVGLIRSFVDEGLSVGAIKHTHHPINPEDKGDSAKFRQAGAHPVILASDHEAFVFNGGEAARITFASPQELLSNMHTDVVLIEGFKHFDGWPRVQLDRTRQLNSAEGRSILDKLWLAPP